MGAAPEVMAIDARQASIVKRKCDVTYSVEKIRFLFKSSDERQ
jgi:hypothetical protein